MGDVNWALGLQNGPDPGQSFANAFQTGLKDRQQQAQALLQQHREGILAAGKIIREISRQNPNMPHDQVYSMARQTAIQMGIPGADQAPPQFDEQYYTGILNAANALDPQAGEGFTLSPGQDRYGANGQVIAHGPAATAPQDPGIIREFDIATQRGLVPPGTTYQQYVTMRNPGLSAPVTIPYGAQVSAGGGDSMPTVSSPDEASRLPPGTQFRMPDGRIGTVPGGAGGNAGGGFPGSASASVFP